MSMPVRLAFIAMTVATISAVALAQEVDVTRLLDRIDRLEAEAEVRDARIEGLRTKLRDYEYGDHVIHSPLEERINALVSVADPQVTAPRSLSLTLGGQLRHRLEYRNVSSYAGTGADDDVDFILQRTRFHADFRVLEDMRAFVQFQDSRLWGEEGSTLADLEGVDFHQAYVDVENLLGHDWTLRVGRQELSYGDQRLVSPLDWHPVGRSFDGIRSWWQGENWTFDLFATNIVEASTVPGGDAGDDHLFAGAYLALAPFENHELDAYVFYRHLNTEVFLGESGNLDDLRDVTLGFRFSGGADGFDYSAEGVFQTGNRAGDDVLAYAWAIVGGYTFDAPWSPRIGLEWDFASGDDDPTDGEFETFDPLFAFVHAYQGYLDIFAWRNGHDIALKISAKPTDELFAEIAVHGFILDSDTDAWYAATGRPIRRAPGGNVRNVVGLELDLHFKYRVNQALSLWFGYSHFFAGGYVEDTGEDPNTSWIFFQTTFNF